MLFDKNLTIKLAKIIDFHRKRLIQALDVTQRIHALGQNGPLLGRFGTSGKGVLTQIPSQSNPRAQGNGYGLRFSPSLGLTTEKIVKHD